jgi:P4 family phage/plasmid primase-like protien
MASNNIHTIDLKSFLEERIVEKGQPYTHTSMGKPFCSYDIKNNDLKTFFSLYEKAIMNGEELHLIEKHEEIGPLVVDFDFKYDENENGDRIHTKEFVYDIVKLYINEICETFEIDESSSKLHAFVFERPSSYIEKNIKKDGIHLIFPYIISTPQAQYFIRENILKKINLILEKLPVRNIASDIIDRSVIFTNGWMLFGSRKPKKDSYQISYIFDGIMNEMDINEYPFTADPPQFFSIRGKKEKDLTIIREDKIQFIEKNNKVKITKSKIKKLISYDLEQIKEMLSILNDDRVDNYHTWIEVGWALHNIDSSSQELLDLWVEFSMRSRKFKEGECEKEWDKSKNDGLGIGSLFHWAKTDNFAKYKIIMNKYVQNYVEKSVKSPTNFDIATVLFHMYKYEYKYTGTEWYMFRDHKWNRENDGMYLRQKISTDLLEKFILLMSDYNKICSSTDQNITEDDREEYKSKNKEITKICLNLKTTAFKDNIVKECKELFYDKNFANNLDTNFYLLGFNNGIYDLKTSVLRDGRPDDYVSMGTGIDKINFNPENEHWNDIKNFIDTVFFEEEVREYFLLFLASCLQGHNAEEKFRIWTGSGCHALDTDILMYDGTIKKVQDIIVGEKIMGDDSSPRNVLELKRGFSDMYDFSTVKGEKFTVNGDHILCLKEINDNNIIEIKVNEYLKNITNLSNHHLYKNDGSTYSFTVNRVKDDNFYGFELDGNHRYLMGNFIVTHNSNGKSKIIELLCHSLGEYTIKFPITMLTGKRAASNAATPEIVMAKGKRFGYFEEPSGNERINAGLLKEFSGGDKITARGLHKDPIEFKPQFKLSLLCNDIPEVPPHDTGISRRLEIIEFKSKFTEHPKEINEFHIDKSLSNKLPLWKELFIAYLLDIYYQKYKNAGIKVPVEVVKFTIEFQKQCDSYDDFISDFLEETKELTDFIVIDEIYDGFKEWYQDSFGNNKYPSKMEFGKYLKKKYTKNYIDKKLKRFRKKNKSNIILNSNSSSNININNSGNNNFGINMENINNSSSNNSSSNNSSSNNSNDNVNELPLKAIEPVVPSNTPGY